MNSLPCAQERCQVLNKSAHNCGQIAKAKAVVLAKRDGSNGNVELKDSFITLPDDVDVGRAMVIRINRNPERAKPQNGWHERSVSGTEAIGFSNIR
jgi:hypothetical protein